jgi:hypothetical protein
VHRGEEIAAHKAAKARRCRRAGKIAMHGLSPEARDIRSRCLMERGILQEGREGRAVVSGNSLFIQDSLVQVPAFVASVFQWFPGGREWLR